MLNIIFNERIQIINKIYKYNKSSEFYNDICYSYSENDLDITNKDRKKDYNNKHLSLCEADCEYKGYDINTKKSECDCNYKLVLENISDIVQHKEKLFDKFTDIKSIFNLNIVKCYKELFTIDGLKNNIGSYILLGMIFLNIICLILFLVKGYKLLIKSIHDIKIQKIKSKITKKKKMNNVQCFHSKKYHNKNRKQVSIYNSTFKMNPKDEKIKPSNDIKKSSFNDYELENLTYKMALKLDKRTYCNYYIYLLGKSQLILFTFITKNDYNIRSIKISIFIIFLALSYAINILFFTDDAIHNILEIKGKFNISNELPKILYSSLISSVINTLIVILALSEKNILELKNSNKKIDKSVKMTKKILKIKFMFFFLLGFLLLFISWYYVSCFCLIYKNTQLYAIEDTAINFGLSLIYPFGLCLIPGIFRIASLRAKRKNSEKMYKFSKFIRDIII